MSTLELMNVVQTMDAVGENMAFLFKSLNKAMAMIHPPAAKSSKLGDVLHNLVDTVEKEHQRLLARKAIIEKRKQEQEERQLLEKQREEERRRLIQEEKKKITEEAEQKRVDAACEQRKNQRIILEEQIEEKRNLMEKALREQLRKKQEKEKKLQKLAKTIDYLERAKREEAIPLVEAAFQGRVLEERALHEREQLQDVELSRERHNGYLREKNRLSRMSNNKMVFIQKVMSLRRAEREQRINQIIRAAKALRSANRKKIFYVTTREEESLKKLHEEEEARKREEAERRRKEEAEAKLDKIALLGRTTDRHSRPSEIPPPAAAAAPAPGKYVPKFRRRQASSESDRWLRKN